MKKTILDLCGGTGSWSKPYKDAGYNVINVTLPQYNVLHYIDLMPKKVYGILAAPPCTMFSFARTTAKTPRDFKSAMKIVRACLEIIWQARINGGLKFWALENPQDYLRQFLGRPAFNFQPYDFGDRYSKETDIWGYFNLPVKKSIKLTERELHNSRQNTRPLPKLPTGYIPVNENNVQARRAMTPQGFALAFFKANK
jgi:hypothetical protein